MKTFASNLQASTQTTYANNGKTTLFGRFFQKLLSTVQCIGAPMNYWLDLFQLYALYPIDVYYNINTGHLFVLASTSTTYSASNCWVMMFNMSAANGFVPAYVGKVNLNFAASPAGAPVFKDFGVYEIGSSINPSVTITHATPAEGGKYTAWNLSAAQFTVGGTVIFPASGSGQQAMYFNQDPAALGVAHVATTAWGGALPQFSSGYIFTVTSANATAGAVYSNNGANFTIGTTIAAGTVLYGVSNAGAPLSSGTLTKVSGTGDATITFSAMSPMSTKTWQANGTFALPQFYGWDLSITPTVAGQILNNISSSTTALAGSSPSAYFSTPVDLYRTAGYSLTLGDQVVLMNGTGNVPTAFTAWAANTLQVAASNVYFLRDQQQLQTFTTTAIASGITAGATYSNNGVTWVCNNTYLAGVTTVNMVSPAAWSGVNPTPSGTLTLVAGTGPAIITFSAVVQGTYYFNLSTTSGGAAVVPTSATSLFTMMRAFGISSNQFYLKTGVLTAITGGALVANTMGYAKPISAPANTTLQLQDCISFLSSTSLYLFKISDLLSNATTWPSLNVAGVLNTGTGLDVTAITAIFGEYCGAGNAGEIDNFVLVTNGSTFIAKPYKVPGSALTAVFGATNDSYYAGQNPIDVEPGVVAPVNLHSGGGFLFACSQTAGQIGISIIDMGSDMAFGYSGLIGPVQQTQPGAILEFITSIEQYYLQTGELSYWIRNGATQFDAAFSSGLLPTPSNANGWTQVYKGQYLTSTSIGPWYQTCVTPYIISNQLIAGVETQLSGTPAQVVDILTGLQLPGESVDDWQLDIDSTTVGLASPSYVGFTCVNVPASLPSNIYIKGITVGVNTGPINDNWVVNPSLFQYWNGTTWAALSSLASAYVIGYKIRYNVASPPGVETSMSLRYAP